jgi:hypothetical protein
MGVAVFAGVDRLAGFGQALLDGQIRRQLGVADLDQIECPLGGLLIHSRHRGDRVPDVAHLVRAQRLLVLADRQHAILDGEVLAGDDPVDARQRGGRRGADRQDACVGSGGSQQRAECHAWQLEIVGEARLAGGFGHAIRLGDRTPDNGQRLFGEGHAVAGCRDSRTTASSTASKISAYPVQRHRLPDRASTICSRVGAGVESSSALAVTSMPGVQ